MIKNYLTIAVRHLRKQAGYSFINIGGLGLGLACAFMIVLFIQHELSFDRFHANSDRLYRMITHVVSGENAGSKSANIAAGFVNEFRERIPEIESAILFDDRNPYLKLDGVSRRIGTVAFMSPEALDAFTFPLIQGDAQTALADPYSIILTESAAQKLFGTLDVVNERITYNEDFDVTITGLMQDIPSNSHLQFTALLPIELMNELMGDDAMQNFSNYNYYLYFLLSPGATPSQVENKLADYRLERAGGNEEEARNTRYELQPITEIHRATEIRWDVSTNIDPTYIYLFSGIAVLILFVAGANFVNLATARASQRAREVGMRKAVGAERKQLIAQFMSESILLALLAILLALILVAVFLPAFRQIIGSSVSFSYGNFSTLAILVGTGLLAGLLSGIYPAVYLSSFRPTAVLKGDITRGHRGNLLRKGLLVFQFGISVFLIVSTLTVYKQLNFLESQSLGFDKEQVVYAPMTAPISENYDAFREAVLSNAHILSVTQAGNMPGRINTTRGYNWPGQSAEEENGRTFYTVLSDYDYLSTLGLTLVAGRDFSRDRALDYENAYILNETAAREIGYASPDEAVGNPFRAWDREMGEIIGVVGDFHFQSLHQEIGPVVINIKPWISYVAFRLTPGNYSESIDFLNAEWQRMAPGFPFEYRFLDEDFDRLYRTEKDLGRLFLFFASLALFIGCLGLFGLSAFTAVQRTKEIGIRKVLGSTSAGVVILLSKDFLVLVLGAFVLAIPIAYFVIQGWLDDFAYRVNIGMDVIIIAGALTLLIAEASVLYQAFRAAFSNPVKALKYE